MSLNLFDPLQVINGDSNVIRPNKYMPDYERMSIYINLKAYRRSNTIINLNDNGYIVNNYGGDMDVNLMGFDPQTNKFTTNWSKNTSIENDNYEGFGISNIKIKTNSSYIPQVTIEFIDVRGMSFMNKGENSPYAVLYDFPPPLFELTIKGYYGKPLKYTLHLVKQNTRFDSTTGNYIITANFIANTFAPLTDILFKYVQTISLMDDKNENVNLDENSFPTTTYELVYKLKNLYGNLDKKIRSTNDFKRFKDTREEINKYNNLIYYINNKNFSDEQNKNNVKFIIKTDKEDESLDNVLYINNINEYFRFSQGEATNNNTFLSNNRLLILFDNNSINTNRINNYIQKIRTQAEIVGINVNIFLDNIGSNVIEKIKTGNKNIDNISNGINIFKYNVIDITDLYNKLYKDFYIKKDLLVSIKSKIEIDVNESVEKYLGFTPTVYNIFKILCDDVDRMFNVLKTVTNEAIEHHNSNYNNIVTNRNYSDTINKVNPFPLFKELRYSGCREYYARIYPKNIYYKENPFPETIFIDDFINQFLQIKREKTPLNIKMVTDAYGNNLWIPINPLDSNIDIGLSDYSSPYFKFENRGGNSLDNIIKILYDRFLVLTQFTYYDSFFNKKNNEIVKLYAESEAINLVESITNDKILNGLINLINSNQLVEKISEFDESLDINIKLNNRDFIIDKNNENFNGLYILEENLVEIRNSGGDTPIDNFLASKISFFQKYFGFGKDSKNGFSKENIQYLPFRDNYLTFFINVMKGYLDNKLDSKFSSERIIEFINNNNNTVSNFLIYSIFGEVVFNENYFNVGINELPRNILILIKLYKELSDEEKVNLLNFTKIINKNQYQPERLYINFQKIIDNISTYDIEYINERYMSYDIVPTFELLYSKLDDNISTLLNRGGEFYSNFTEKIIKFEYLVVLSESTFKNFNRQTYLNYNQLIESSDTRDVVRNYFNLLNNNLNNKLNKKRDSFNKETKEFYDSINDDDIKTQTYYSIKNIVDKWVRGTDLSKFGYPFNKNGGKLIDQFAFVNRNMGNVNDCIINVDSLIEMSDDLDINIFTVMSRLLSQNGFEFFPLQNFMEFENNNWEDSFKIYDNINDDILSKPAFVCMYIGGTSSTLGTNGNYIDDGVLSLEELSDFTQDGCEKYDEDFKNNYDNSNTINYGIINAFQVKYGSQGQSIFKDIEIDSKEFPETNESLAILSKLANDESNTTPVPKAQNLYNLYENRAYSTKITMLGNVMIQPTQYFELQNIPLFNGAYVILNVEHDIVPNHMKTIFSGVRILKYPNPIVTNFSESIGMIMGLDTSISIEGFGNRDRVENLKSVDGNILPDEAKYSAMHSNNPNTLII